jgi:hypothetical protein
MNLVKPRLQNFKCLILYVIWQIKLGNLAIKLSILIFKVLKDSGKMGKVLCTRNLPESN